MTPNHRAATDTAIPPSLHIGTAVRWRRFCEQWRHCYLLLTSVFLVVWIVSGPLMPRLENTRIGGLHPVDVLFFMDMLKLSKVFPLVALALYAASFLIPTLNTPKAVAVSALSSVTVLALVLLGALFHIGLWS
jgi:hypothetical protein